MGLIKSALRALTGAAPARGANAIADSYRGASFNAPGTKRWFSNLLPADRELEGEQGTLIARARDMVRNDGIAAGYARTHEDTVVGTGLRLSARPDWRALGIAAAAAEDWTAGVEAHWRGYADSVAVDAGGRLPFWRLQRLVIRALAVDGEALILPVWRGHPDSRFQTAFQLIDPERLAQPIDKPETPQFRQGIEVDTYGAPVAYWIRNQHPAETGLGFSYRITSDGFIRVPARTAWGRPQVIHLYDQHRPGQRRGVPPLAPVLAEFRTLAKYKNAELDAAVVNALVAAFIETNMPQQELEALIGEGFEAYRAERDKWGVAMEPGSVIPLHPGDKLSSFTPGRPNAAFAAFEEAVLRHIGVAVGAPYEVIKKDFSKTNYSSARAALLEWWRYVQPLRGVVSSGFCSVAYRLWLEEAIDLGLVDAADFYGRMSAWTRARWIGPGRGWVDPVKEAQAAGERLALGLTTLEDEIAEQGGDLEEIVEQRAREKALLEKAGLPWPPSTLVAAPSAGPATQDGGDPNAV